MGDYGIGIRSHLTVRVKRRLRGYSMVGGICVLLSPSTVYTPTSRNSLSPSTLALHKNTAVILHFGFLARSPICPSEVGIVCALHLGEIHSTRNRPNVIFGSVGVSLAGLSEDFLGVPPWQCSYNLVSAQMWVKVGGPITSTAWSWPRRTSRALVSNFQIPSCPRILQNN